MRTINMTKTTLFCYNLGKINPSTRTSINRELYGYKDLSNHGKYSYKRNGILEKIEHKKLVGSIIMINHEDTSKLTKIFKKYSVNFHIFEVE